MPISDHYRRQEKLAVTIVTVDTTTMRVEGVGKDAAVIQISVNQRPAGFRWPKEGEVWIICREGTEWALLSKIEDPDSLSLSEGEPGDLMGPDGYIPQHVTKATAGQALVWTSDGWVPENIATQTELAATQFDVAQNALAIDDLSDEVDTIDGRVDSLEVPYTTQHIEGTNVAYYNSHGGAGSVDLTQNGASGPMTLSYTPTVSVWWDLNVCVGLIQKDDANYHYMEFYGQMTAGAIPAVGSGSGFAVNNPFMYAIHTGHLTVQTYTSFHVHRRVPLTAGVAYTFKARLSVQGGIWSYYQSPDRLYMQGRVYPR